MKQRARHEIAMKGGSRAGLISRYLRELVEEPDLAPHDPPPCLGEREPRSTVDFRKLARSPRPGRPLDRERVALQAGGVAVPRDRPHVNDLAARLLQRGQRDVVALSPAPRLFAELPLGGLQEILPGRELSLGDGPGPEVFPR